MEMTMGQKKYEDSRYGRAKKRVDEMKGFYIHLAVYLAINIFILINIGIQTNDFWHWGHFITPFFWGIGLFFHWFNTFGKNPLFGKDWEERKIKELMDKDRDNTKKYL